MNFKLTIDKTQEERVEATLRSKGDFAYRLEELVRGYSGATSITASTEDDIKVLAFSEIECLTVENGTTYALTVSGERFRLKRKLYEIGELLPAYFMKINKSSIANRNRIEKFAAAFSGSVDVIFKSGYRDYVSRRCFADIKKELK